MGKFMLALALFIGGVGVHRVLEQTQIEADQVLSDLGSDTTEVKLQTIDDNIFIVDPDVKIHDATVENLVDLVKEGVVVVHFRSSDSKLSKKQDAVLVILAKKYKGKIEFANADVETEKKLVEVFEIQKVPSLVVFSDGQRVQFKSGDDTVKTLIGFRSEDKLSRLLDSVLKAEHGQTE